MFRSCPFTIYQWTSKLEPSEQLQQNKLTSKPFDGREIAVKKSFKLLPSFKRKKKHLIFFMQNCIILPQRFRLKMMRIYKGQTHNFRLGFERECPIEKIDNGCHHECAQQTSVSINTNRYTFWLKKCDK